MLRYSELTPYFDERFVNYGCNKVQFIDLLRNMGYRFYILTQSFAMDIAHHEYTPISSPFYLAPHYETRTFAHSIKEIVL